MYIYFIFLPPQLFFVLFTLHFPSQPRPNPFLLDNCINQNCLKRWAASNIVRQSLEGEDLPGIFSPKHLGHLVPDLGLLQFDETTSQLQSTLINIIHKLFTALEKNDDGASFNLFMTGDLVGNIFVTFPPENVEETNFLKM